MDAEQEREDFVQAWAQETGCFPLRSFAQGMTFKGDPAEKAWKMWQARAARQSQDQGNDNSVEALSYLKGMEAGQRVAQRMQDREDVVPYRLIAQAAHGLFGSAQYERLMDAIDHARRIGGGK